MCLALLAWRDAEARHAVPVEIKCVSHISNCGLVTVQQVLPVHWSGSIVNVASPRPRFDLTLALPFVPL